MNSPSLIEQIEAKLAHRLKQNTKACDKLWEVRNELQALAKRVGKLVPYYDGITYYAPVRGGGLMEVLSCYIDRDKTVLLLVGYDGKRTEEIITHVARDQVVAMLSHFLAHRIADGGVYKI